MSTISKIRINQSGDMVRLDKNFIFLNIDNYEVKKFNSISLKQEVRVHVFISSMDDIRNGYLDDLIIIFRDNNEHPRSKFIIHVPWDVRSVIPQIEKVYACVNKDPFRIVMERKGLYFRIPNTDLTFNIDYKDNKIVSSIPMYFRDIIKKKDMQGIQNIMHEKEKHKAEYLEFFKGTNPLSILKSFKDEDDIWDYIMMQNEWAPTKQEDEIRVKKSVTINTTEKDPNKLKAMIEDMFKNAADEIRKEIEDGSDNNEDE